MDRGDTHTEFTALRRPTAKCDKCNKKGHLLINKCIICVQHLCSQCLDDGASPNHTRSPDAAAKAAAAEAEVHVAAIKRKTKKIKSGHPTSDPQNVTKSAAAKRTSEPQLGSFAPSPTKYLQETTANPTVSTQSRPLRSQTKPIQVRISHSQTKEPSETKYGAIILREWNMPTSAKIEGGVYVADAGSDSDSARTIDDAPDFEEHREQNNENIADADDPFVARERSNAAGAQNQAPPSVPFSPLTIDVNVARITSGSKSQSGPLKPEITIAANTLRTLAVKRARKADVAWPEQAAEPREPNKRKKLTAVDSSTIESTIFEELPVTPKRGDKPGSPRGKFSKGTEHYPIPVREASPSHPTHASAPNAGMQSQENLISYEHVTQSVEKAPRGSSQMTRYLYATNNRYKHDGFGIDVLLAAADLEAIFMGIRDGHGRV